VKNVLFVCSKNRLRSPTAEHLFGNYPGIECASAGLSNDAEIPLTPELIQWADLIFVMEKRHRIKLSAKFRKYLGKCRVICLDIPDSYDYMDPELVSLLKKKVTGFLSSTREMR
jgi:predicted protein tyrosine phosphatase